MDGLKAQDENERDSISLHMEQLNAFKTLKDPAHGRACRWLLDLVGDRLFGLSETEAGLRSGVSGSLQD